MKRLSYQYIDYRIRNQTERLSSLGGRFLGLQTRDQKALLSLRDSCRGRPCFVIGNGPSLLVSDLDNIERLGAVSIASNRVYLMFADTTWRPSCYTVADELIIRQNTREIADLDLIKLLPMRRRALVAAAGTAGQLVGFRVRGHKPRPVEHYHPSPSVDALRGFFVGQTVTTLNLQLALWLGCRDIFVIGLDGRYSTGPRKVADQDYGEVLISDGELNHFHPDYRKSGEPWATPRTDLHEKEYHACRALIEACGGRIWNASRATAVKAFEPMDIESAFAICAGHHAGLRVRTATPRGDS